MALYYSLAAGAAASAGFAFATLCGRVLPYEPIAIFPLRVFLSPFPMIVKFNNDFINITIKTTALKGLFYLIHFTAKS